MPLSTRLDAEVGILPAGVPVPEPKAAKNRVHWDVVAPSVAPLFEAGARMLREPGGDIGWHVMADPEGNEFCAFTEHPGS